MSNYPWKTVGCARGLSSPLWYASPFVSDAAAGLLPYRDLNTLAGAMTAACGFGEGAKADATRCAALSQMYGRAATQTICVMGQPGAPVAAAAPPVLADIQAQQVMAKSSVLAALSAVGSAPSGVSACGVL